MANVYCGACGRIIDIEDVFCVFCGKKRKNEIKADIEDLDLEQPLNLSSFLEEKKEERCSRFSGKKNHQNKRKSSPLPRPSSSKQRRDDFVTINGKV